MSNKINFTQKLLGEKKESDDDDYDDAVADNDLIVPDDDEIEERIRTLDEVSKCFRDDKLLGVNSYKKVSQASEKAKKGITKKSFGKSLV